MPTPSSQVSAPMPTITAPCTLDTCPLDWALVRYMPSLPGTALYLVLFLIMLLVQIYQGFRSRTWSYLACMTCGLLLEVVGYGGRLMLHANPFNFSGFLQYLICLTIGPAFITAAIYLCFRRVIIIYGESFSRIKSRTYAIVFVTCDLLCLILQAAGGAVTATAGREQDGLRHTGINIMITGLAAQVASLGAFMALAIDYLWRLRRQRQSQSCMASSGVSWKWRGFLWVTLGLGIATFLIFIRSIFRTAELNGGFSSDLANDEIAFMILEGASMIVTCRRCDGPSLTQTSPVTVSFAQTWTLTPTVRLRQLPKLWDESEQDTRYVQYFIECLSRDTPSCGGEYSHWRPLMIQAMHQEVAVRRGVVALSALMQERLAHGSLGIHGFDAPPRSGRYLFGLKKYGRALTSLQKLVKDMGSDRYLIQVALLCGIICIWFEILMRDYLAGLSHLEMCLKIVRNAGPFGNVDSEIQRAYVRMDIQASLYVGIRAPVTVPEEMSPIPYVFDSFNQAESCLMEEYARVVHFFRNVASFYRHHQPGCVPLEFIAYTHTLQARLELWKSAFGYSYSCQKAQGSPQTSARASLLLIQYYIALVTASTSVYAEQTLYDRFLYAFKRILLLAKSSNAFQVSAAATSLVGVPMEMGVIYPLYFVATKCRDSIVRQEAIDLLSSAPYPDVVWEAPILALVSQRAKEIEEIGLDGDQPIPEFKRIHSLGLDIDPESRQVRVEFRRRSNGMDGEWDEWRESLSW
ncbi:RTA1 domain-containing protein [Aspergillus thermomutatus]|uniref:Uncharacterized protein n=1 Tax=Aspergillus thermomutatus TaxID=41047 RepID=A0A397HPI5_ASPTH|nr:uncharacterized protein CDV56_107986 [Aspergillus thermomutatus]RHZ64932.1 hypothetical protein CDV56_107986 [Aspergillus thermomutatus]